ncbi:SagB/ThcOx family dehydrogenase [Endomicrobium proavitum]|uniref:Nitroreductase n=1 Tax=Endomicrobium proavitum TaxID=1408281 RepID=A0A0G3WKE8_9BACT|nr:SagB/ThcOx family dehydrogenase [Endomicrobium proavitum]AKL98357.1 Nitroreductase [Endomicrobium proavitum]
MNKIITLVFAAMFVCAEISFAKDITLIKPDFSKNNALITALKDRQSSRNFTDKNLDIDTLSELLWAAGGVNRSNGHKTYPTAMNAQEVEIYVFDKTGAYLYDAKNSKLVLIAEGDKRADTGSQGFAAKASVNLIYVSDISKLRGSDDNAKLLMSAVSVGAVTQNVALYCASKGLGNVVRASVDADKVSKILKLSKTQKVVIAQSVGHIK